MQHFKPTWYNAQAVIYTLNMVGFLITNPLMIFAQVRCHRRRRRRNCCCNITDVAVESIWEYCCCG